MAATSGDVRRQDLAIEGMTCAACANRIQRKLTRLDGVAEAQVNFATGRATVLADDDGPAVADELLVATIEGLGYGVIDEDETEQAEARREAGKPFWR